MAFWTVLTRTDEQIGDCVIIAALDGCFVGLESWEFAAAADEPLSPRLAAVVVPVVVLGGGDGGGGGVFTLFTII